MTVEQDLRDVPCRACGALKGEPCLSRSGNPHTISHAVRWHDWRATTGQPPAREQLRGRTAERVTDEPEQNRDK